MIPLALRLLRCHAMQVPHKTFKSRTRIRLLSILGGVVVESGGVVAVESSGVEWRVLLMNLNRPDYLHKKR